MKPTRCTRYSNIPALRERLNAERAAGKRIGFLATMGALHEGHLSLAHSLARDAEVRVASIFVNPTQFNDRKDYEAYLINIDADQRALELAGVDVLFAPSADEMYPSGFETKVTPGVLAARWEGEFRPGHFEGMATVVAMLFAIVSPDVTIFGEKDFQQLRIVEQMVKDLKLPIRVIRGALVREENGLAMSSRNARLSHGNRAAAAAINRGLLKAQQLCASGVKESAELVKAALAEISTISDHTVDYLAVVDEATLEPLDTVHSTTAHSNSRILTVVRVQGVRLLDNIALTLGE